MLESHYAGSRVPIFAAILAIPDWPWRAAPPTLGAMLRVLAFCLCASFIVLAPLSDPLGKRKPYLPRWTMFGGIALNQFEVLIRAQEPGKPARTLDRYDVLGFPDHRKAPDYVRRIRSVSDAQRMVQNLCRRVPPGTRLSVRLRKATRRGWDVFDDGSRDACAPNSARGRRP